MKGISLSAIMSVAYKEFLHIYRDRRVLLLLLILPPLFTLLFGHAFENTQLTDVPALLINRDDTPRTARFVDIILKDKTFQWRKPGPGFNGDSDLLANGVKASLVIPAGWSETLGSGDPKPLPLYLDDSDTNTATTVEGAMQQNLANFQAKERDLIVESLPDEVIELGKKLPINIRKQFVSLMSAWGVETKNLYNPKSRFIDYVLPGIIGLILQLLTVTLMACTIARERESGTLYQLMVTSLKRGEIVIDHFALSTSRNLSLMRIEHRNGDRGPQALLALGLTAREAEVLYWITEGKTNPEIAIILDSSINTVKKHANNLFAKIGVETRTSAARAALQVLSPQ